MYPWVIEVALCTANKELIQSTQQQHTIVIFNSLCTPCSGAAAFIGGGEGGQPVLWALPGPVPLQRAVPGPAQRIRHRGRPALLQVRSWAWKCVLTCDFEWNLNSHAVHLHPCSSEDDEAALLFLH
jgi:hypothetical protein